MRDAGGGPEMPRSGRLALKLQVEDLLGMIIDVVGARRDFLLTARDFLLFW